MKYSPVVVLVIFSLSCNRNYTPKPEGYVRVDYPDKEYVLFDKADPYVFEYPTYAQVLPNQSRITEPYWYDIVFPSFKGTVFLSYKNLNSNIESYIEDTRKLVYRHAARSDGILEIPFVDTANRRYGIFYKLNGNVASAVQFFLTDSSSHFLRGSLYFESAPNRDSLNPIINFIEKDIEHLIETVRWK
jgi:gliding motility-associated lipoprotein GldD